MDSGDNDYLKGYSLEKLKEALRRGTLAWETAPLASEKIEREKEVATS